jgi:phosphoribosylanthranilate isomerase
VSVKVKICGLTRPEDAQAAAVAGADLVGFMFYAPSPRCVSFAQAAALNRVLPAHIVRVGVFVNPVADIVTQAIAACGLTMLQFHGDEPPEFCAQFGLLTLKAFRIRDAASLAALPSHPADAWLLDAWSPAAPGGTGERFNWDLAVAARKLGRPIFLAGGLTPENVAGAVRQVQPFGVDVSSGVESAPGVKDAAKIHAFVAAAKAARNDK